jgi:hypothetical protein
MKYLNKINFDHIFSIGFKPFSFITRASFISSSYKRKKFFIVIVGKKSSIKSQINAKTHNFIKILKNYFPQQN